MDGRRLSAPNKIRRGSHSQRDTELDISTSKGDQRLQCKKKHGSDLYYKHHAVLNCREDCKALHFNFKLTSSPVLHTSGCMKGAEKYAHGCGSIHCFIFASPSQNINIEKCLTYFLTILDSKHTLKLSLKPHTTISIN